MLETLRSIQRRIRRAHCHIAGHVPDRWGRWRRVCIYLWTRSRHCERCGEVLEIQQAVANEQGVHVDTTTGYVTRLEIE